jgi:hypothetical protein
MIDEFEKIATPRGDGRSMAPLKPYNLNVSFGGGYPSAAPGEGSGWFGPLPPMHPVAPAEVAGRTWDYIPGYNLSTQPRAYEPVKF